MKKSENMKDVKMSLKSYCITIDKTPNWNYIEMVWENSIMEFGMYFKVDYNQYQRMTEVATEKLTIDELNQIFKVL